MTITLNRSWVRYGGFSVLVLGIILGFLWQRWEQEKVAIAPLPQDPYIQVYFNHAQASHYHEPYRDQSRPGDNLEQVIIDTINQAQVSIDVAIQELNLPLIADALAAKHQQGVAVRVIVENQYRQPLSNLNSGEIDGLAERDRSKYNEFLQLADFNQDGQVQRTEALQRDAMAILEAADIPLIDDTADGSKGSGLMHHKFLVVDGQTSLMGSANFTISGIHGDFSYPDSLGNVNHIVVIQNEAIAQELTSEFELMWGDGPDGQPNSLFGLQKPYRPSTTTQITPDSSVTLYFSPISDARYSWDESGNGLIGRTLNTAQSSLDLALFVFSDQNLSRILQQQSERDRTIRALIDSEFIYRNYSEALDMMGVAYPNKQCQYDDGNKPWPRPLNTVGTPQLAEGDKLHHKFAVIDQSTTITGSQNWSDSANHRNDELILIIKNKVVSAHFVREFHRLYGHANFGVPTWLQSTIQDHQTRCKPK